MVTLPDWTAIGAQAPQPSFRRVQPDSAGRIVEAGTESLAQGLGVLSNDLYQTQKAEDAKAQSDAINLARAQSNNAAAEHEIGVRQAALTVKDQIATGQLPYTQAQQAFGDAVSKLKPPQIPNLDPVGQQNYQKALTRNLQTSGFDIENAVTAARRADFKDQFTQNLDNLGKLTQFPGADIQSINDRADAAGPLAREAGVPQATIDTALNKFKQQNWFNDATQRAMSAKEDPRQLKLLAHDLTDNNGYYVGKMDTQQRNEILRTVTNDQIILQNKLEHEQDKREAKAQGAMNQINEQISSGVPATPAMWQNWQGLTKGTAAESEFHQALDDETKVQNVLRQPVDQQISYVQQQTQKLENEGGSLRDRANLMRLSTAVNQNVNLMQKAPLLFAANRNGADIPALDFSKASDPQGQQTLAAQVDDRMNTLTALRKQYGPAIANAPLLPQEAQQLASRLDSSTPQDRFGLLTTLRSTFQNDEAYQAAMRQIAPHSPVTAIVGQSLGNAQPSSTPAWFDRSFLPNQQDAQRILRGETLLNPDKGAAGENEKGSKFTTAFPMPTTARNGQTLQQMFGQAAGDLFRDRPQLAGAYYNTFQAAYAALMAEKGNMKGVPDPGIEQQALQIALGKDSQRVDFNGQTIRVPDGMDPTRFEGIVRNAVGATAKAAGAGDDWQQRIRGYQLQELGGYGSGQYKLFNGTQEIARPDGRGPIIIDLKGQYSPIAVQAATRAGTLFGGKAPSTQGADFAPGL